MKEILNECRKYDIMCYINNIDVCIIQQVNEMLKHEKVKFLEDLFISCQSIWSWHYSKELDLINTNCPNAASYRDMFINNRKQIHMLAHDKKLPSVITDKTNRAWAIIMDNKSEDDCVYYVLGPVHIKNGTEEKEYVLVNKSCIPFADTDEFNRYTSMLDMVVNGHSDKSKSDNLYSTQILAQLQEKVKNGDLNYKDLMFGILSDRASLHQLGVTTIGSAREMAILSIDLCCQSAIACGLTRNSISSLYEQYVPQIRQSESGQEIAQLSNTMIYHLIRLIRHLRGQKVYSVPVQDCCTYIEEHVLDKLTLESIAKKIGYSADHLSRVFTKEVGEPLKEYVIKLKIYNAKLWLTTTNMSVGDISDKLSFCSNSHFTKVFKEYEKKTPLEYRSLFTHMV